MPGQADFRRANVLVDLQRPAESIPYAKRAAAAGSANAGLLLGRAYHFGIGVPVDLKEAAKWYRQSSDGGLADGSRHMAYMYEFGLGVGVNRPQALHYYDLASKRGDAMAKKAAANLRSPDYDRPPANYSGGSSTSSSDNRTECQSRWNGQDTNTGCRQSNGVYIDPHSGEEHPQQEYSHPSGEE